MDTDLPVPVKSVYRPVSIGFTELLYGVLIGTAITRIESFAISRDVVLLLLALLLAFEDYLVFHFDVQHIPDTGKNFIVLLVLDLFTLACWYGIVLATKYPDWVYYSALATYFGATTIWGWYFPSPQRRGVWDNGDLPLVLTAVALAFAASLVSLWLGLLGIVTVLVWWRLPLWRRIWLSPTYHAR